MQRPLLQHQLSGALESRKLVLLCAPAGYGKTVALVQALAALPAGDAVAWVAAVEGDGLHRLLTSLLAALDPFDLPWRISPEALPEVAQRERGLRDAAAELARTLEQAGAPRGVIAVDDVHRIDDARVFAFFEALLRLLPERWTLAMISRVDPPLALARIRLAGDVAEFREAQLRFDADAVLALLRSQNLQAGTHDVQELLASTGGWPTGLAAQVMVSLQRTNEPRAKSVRLQRRLFDYLAEEVLEQLPEDFRAFLLRCSVLPEWTAERCAHVSGDARAAQWLDMLEQRGLFVTLLEADELTLRPHDLFREFLQWQLALVHTDELPGLLKHAAEDEPDPVARVDYLLRAGATAEALREIMRVGPSVILAGADEQLLGLIDRFPATERDASPELAFLRGLCAWHRYRFDIGTPCFLRATEGFERSRRWSLAVQARAIAVIGLVGMAQPEEARRLWQAAPVEEVNPTAEIARELAELLLCSLYGPAPMAAVHLSRMVELLRSQPEPLQWICFYYMQIHFGGRGLRAPLQALVRAMAQASSDDATPRLKLMTLLWSAWVALWGGDVPAARALREQAAVEAKWLGEPPSVRVPLQQLAATEKHLTGDAPGAQQILRLMAEEARANPGRRTASIYLNLAGAFASAVGDWPVAQAALSSVEEELRRPSGWPHPEVMAAALRAELALHRHADREARDLLHGRLQAATDSDYFGIDARVRVALARAELRLTNASAAWEVLQPLLQEARASGEWLGLLTSGPQALAELAGGRWPPEADASLLAVLRHAAAEAARLRAGAREASPSASHDIALPERELQVLQLVAQGRSNKLIARELDLSPHTVKRHMARIFDRTGQTSRLQAAAWYRSQIERGGEATS